MERKVSKTCISPNKNIISKEFIDVIHKQDMKRKFAMIRKEADVFGLLFLGDGATMSRCPLLNIQDYGGNIPVFVLDIADLSMDIYLMEIKKTENLFVIDF